MVVKRLVVAFLNQLLLAIQSRFTRRARLETENLLFTRRSWTGFASILGSTVNVRDFKDCLGAVIFILIELIEDVGS